MLSLIAIDTTCSKYHCHSGFRSSCFHIIYHCLHVLQLPILYFQHNIVLPRNSIAFGIRCGTFVLSALTCTFQAPYPSWRPVSGWRSNTNDHKPAQSEYSRCSVLRYLSITERQPSPGTAASNLLRYLDVILVWEWSQTPRPRQPFS
jgi:hypothetical protein